MTRINIAPSGGASALNPVSNLISRVTKDGSIDIISLFVGSHFNESLDGLFTYVDEGNFTSAANAHPTGKVSITTESTDGSLVKRIGTVNTFTYFYQRARFMGNLEIQNAQVGESAPDIKYIQRARYLFEDLSTSDQIIVDLESGNSVANTPPELLLKEVVDGVESILATEELPVGTLSVDWEIHYLDEGVTKLFYKTSSTVKQRIFKGDLSVDMAEAKIQLQVETNQQTPITIKSEFIWIFYPAIFLGFKTGSPLDISKGRIKVFDTQGVTSPESDWYPVNSGDHNFTGETVVENGLIRLWFKSTALIEVYGWNVTNTQWEKVGEIQPVDDSGQLAGSVTGILFEKYNKSYVRINANFGVTNYKITLRRGNPHARIVLGQKVFRFDTIKERMALHVATNATDIPDFNVLNSDDASRGNPLNLAAPVTTFTFTDDATAATGLDLIDDNWFAFYDTGVSAEMVGIVAFATLPNSMSLTATSSTVLDYADWGFFGNTIATVGILETDITVVQSGIPKAFKSGDDDTYVKWRANESVMSYDATPFVRKRREG